MRYSVSYRDLNGNIEVLHIGPARSAEHATTIFAAIYGDAVARRIVRVNVLQS